MECNALLVPAWAIELCCRHSHALHYGLVTFTHRSGCEGRRSHCHPSRWEQQLSASSLFDSSFLHLWNIECAGWTHGEWEGLSLWQTPVSLSRVNLLAELSRRCGLMKLQLAFSSARGPLWMYPASLHRVLGHLGPFPFHQWGNRRGKVKWWSQSASKCRKLIWKQAFHTPKSVPAAPLRLHCCPALWDLIHL